MDRPTQLATEANVALWDGVLAGCRQYMRSVGAREVCTPTLVAAPAIEPHIEPLRAESGYLITSPELAMKRLLCHGSGSIFQIAAVFRADEVGALHRPEFRLLEWYRLGVALADVMGDVERLVARAFSVGGRATPSWQRVHLMERLRADLHADLVGTESATELVPLLARVSGQVGVALGPHGRVRDTAPDAATIAVWTELYTLWSVHWFDVWLRDHARGGVHLYGFPPPLAALSRVEDGTAQRFESFVDAVELANGYVELADGAEQRRRFEAVNSMREAASLPRLPLDERFLHDLAQGLPDCAGVALGLERLVMLASNTRDLADIVLVDDARPT